MCFRPLSKFYVPGTEERQGQYNQRTEALENFEILNGYLAYKPRKPNASPRRVVPISEAFTQIKEVHAQLGHAGGIKTFKTLHERYYSITKPQVQWLIARCNTCLKNQPNRSRGQIEPIISSRILERIQIDLIDMRHEPDGQHKWILHIVDHFSKFSSLIPLKSKRAVEVADAIAVWIGYFEPPAILQCDNGKEFKGVLLILLQKYGVKVINGRPRTPSTQGLVEQANGTVKTRPRAAKEDTDTVDWVDKLSDIALKINRSVHGATGKAPYEVMFGRKTRWNEHLSPLDRQTVTLDTIEDETVDLIVTDGPPDDSHDFRFSYTFDAEDPTPLTRLSEPSASTPAPPGLPTATTPPVPVSPPQAHSPPLNHPPEPVQTPRLTLSPPSPSLPALPDRPRPPVPDVTLPESHGNFPQRVRPTRSLAAPSAPQGAGTQSTSGSRTRPATRARLHRRCEG